MPQCPKRRTRWESDTEKRYTWVSPYLHRKEKNHPLRQGENNTATTVQSDSLSESQGNCARGGREALRQPQRRGMRGCLLSPSLSLALGLLSIPKGRAQECFNLTPGVGRNASPGMPECFSPCLPLRLGLEECGQVPKTFTPYVQDTHGIPVRAVGTSSGLNSGPMK